jgi:heat shock protein HslJ
VTLNINGRGSGGSGGCNSFGAIATGSTTGRFSIRLGIHTDMACVGAERDITEHHYFAALGKIDTALMTSDELTLTGPGVSLTFERSAS